jgi:hypothetical protein
MAAPSAPTPLLNAFADFDPLARPAPSASTGPMPPTAAVHGGPGSASASSPAERSRSRNRRRKTNKLTRPVPNVEQQQGGQAAPWDVDPEIEAAEKREDARKALRKAIEAKRAGRTNHQALRSQAEQRKQPEQNGEIPDRLSVLQNIDAKAIQAVMKAAGVGGDVAPSARKLRRKLAAMGDVPDSVLAKMAGSLRK